MTERENLTAPEKGSEQTDTERVKQQKAVLIMSVVGSASLSGALHATKTCEGKSIMSALFITVLSALQ